MAEAEALRWSLAGASLVCATDLVAYPESWLLEPLLGLLAKSELAGSD